MTDLIEGDWVKYVERAYRVVTPPDDSGTVIIRLSLRDDPETLNVKDVEVLKWHNFPILGMQPGDPHPRLSRGVGVSVDTRTCRRCDVAVMNQQDPRCPKFN